MCPHYILIANGMEFKSKLMDNFLQQLDIDHIFSGPYHHKVMINWRYSTNTSNQLLKNCVKMIQATGTNTSTTY